MRTKWTSRRSIFSAMACTALVAAACGGGSSTSSSGGSGAQSALLGPSKPATGTPVKIGFVSDGKSAAIDNSSEIPAAQATAKYINEHLGGIGGHPIQIDSCSTLNTPSGATTCATQMVNDKVAAVLVPVSGQSVSVFNGVNAAGIPFVESESSDQQILLAKNTFVLTNSLNDFVGAAKIAQNAGAKRAAVVGIDLPSVTQPVKTIDSIFYKNAGITLDYVPVPPGTADMTPQIQAELSKNPDQVEVIGDAAFCTSALKPLKTLGFSKTIVLINQCINPGSAQTIPGGYSGMKVVTVNSSNQADPGVQLFNAVMKTYSPSTQIVDVTSGAYATVLGFARAMSGLTGDVTPTTVGTTFAAMAPQAWPLGQGITFQCNGKQIVFTPAVCSTGGLVATLNSSGSPQGGYQTLDSSNLLKLS
jgi:branched-chain amino acid transport system substrate-binding protein